MLSKIFIASLYTFLLYNLAWAADPYERINPPQPVKLEGKIEVVEVFWYGCPHCYSLEPYLEKWLQTKPDDVEFRRIPGVLGKNWIPHAKTYFTAEKLGIVEKIHRPLFDAIHLERAELNSEKKLANFFEQHGVDPDEFIDIYESTEINDLMKQAFKAGQGYGLTGVPVIIVNGKFRVSASTAGGNTQLIEVLNLLIEKERRAAATEG